MGRSAQIRMLAASLALAACAAASWSGPRSSLDIEAYAGRGSVAGVVRRMHSGEPYSRSIILLKCSCTGERLVQVTADGLYRFDDLPPGRYTIEALGEELERSFELPPGARARVDFFVEPRGEIVEPWHRRYAWPTGITGK